MINHKNRQFIFISLILFSLAVHSCTKRPEQEPLGTILEREIPRLMEAADVPGFSMAVVRGGQIFWKGAFGVRSRESNEPVDENTMFEAASLTKTVTAYAALRLVERGKLDLDRPLHEYFPNKEYAKLSGDERYKQLTARLVLTHTTGLPNWGSKFIRDPGKQYAYSGEGFLYLGRTIEQISGLSLQDFAQKEVFDPLGMAHTSYVWNDIYAANGASGHDRHGTAQAQRKNTEPNGGASLLSTAADYAKFICVILNAEGLKKETVDEMVSPQVQVTKSRESDELFENVFWGWGWGVQPGKTGYGFWHWGDNGELRAYTVTYRDRGEGLVYFANSTNGLALAQAVTALVFGDHQYALDWLDYEKYDDPKRMARMSIEKSFLNEGKEAGLKKLQQARGELPGLLDENGLNSMAQYLDGRGKGEEAIAVYKFCLESFPESLDAYRGLGTAYMGRGENQAAIESFEKALKVKPDDKPAERGIQWAKEALKAENNPVHLSAEEMEKYVGDYGPRRISLREGRLYYQREGRPEFRLHPLTTNTFALEGYVPFRIEFVLDETGLTTKIVGHYLDGTTDESLRDR